MANILIRDVDDGVLARLKQRAERNDRSLQAELRLIVEHAAAVNPVDARSLAAKIRRKLSGRAHSDSAALIAHDRER